MSVKVERVCDFVGSVLPERHPGTVFAELNAGGVVMTMDVCADDLPALRKALVSLGFKPSRARVGKDTREAYVTASGETFTSKQARNWLIHSMGREMPPNGRLSVEDLRAYAEAH